MERLDNAHTVGSWPVANVEESKEKKGPTAGVTRQTQSGMKKIRVREPHVGVACTTYSSISLYYSSSVANFIYRPVSFFATTAWNRVPKQSSQLGWCSGDATSRDYGRDPTFDI